MRKEVCGFANGHETAYLILGAAESEAGWVLDGLDFGGDPPAWVSAVIADGLRPVPLVDVRPIPLGDGRHLAVVEVPPVAIAPCISRGTVYERVSGRTIPVKDPARLAELYRRGALAGERALAGAQNAARKLIDDPSLPGAHDNWPRVSVAVAAAGHPSDFASRLFSVGFEEKFEEVVREHLIPNHGVPDPFAPTLALGFEQSNRYADCSDLHTHIKPCAWHVRAIWDGSVAVYGNWEVERIDAPQLNGVLIAPAWAATERLVAELGGYGPTQTEIGVEGGQALLGRGGQPLGPLQMARGPLAAPPSAELLAGLERELRRACGEPVYEEPAGGGDAG